MTARNARQTRGMYMRSALGVGVRSAALAGAAANWRCRCPRGAPAHVQTTSHGVLRPRRCAASAR
eukprot:4376897-Prymnesium_polylepis.1